MFLKDRLLKNENNAILFILKCMRVISQLPENFLWSDKPIKPWDDFFGIDNIFNTNDRIIIASCYIDYDNV